MLLNCNEILCDINVDFELFSINQSQPKLPTLDAPHKGYCTYKKTKYKYRKKIFNNMLIIKYLRNSLNVYNMPS